MTVTATLNTGNQRIYVRIRMALSYDRWFDGILRPTQKKLDSITESSYGGGGGEAQLFNEGR